MQRVITIIRQRANDREIVLYGCSDMCEALHQMLEGYGCKVSFFVDRNHSLFHGYGCKVVSPDVISPDKHFVILEDVPLYSIVAGVWAIINIVLHMNNFGESSMVECINIVSLISPVLRYEL